ncbi:YhbY family RNA-binding protein [Candidatus Woesearchaeota archaeon]|nr:YhbY family RNA-binding protein [Candidatus Woesearchaeota archaeon]
MGTGAIGYAEFGDRRLLAELRGRAQALAPAMQVGKNGVTPNVVADLKRHLKRRRLVKVRLLKGFIEGRDRFAEAQAIAQATESTLIQVVGFSVVLYKAPAAGLSGRNVFKGGSRE